MKNSQAAEIATSCIVCHQPILSTYYFCPNCGIKIIDTPLSTSLFTQIKLYIFSIILPMICFITIWRWQGGNYLKSKDEKTRTIGVVACLLLVISTILTIWITIITTQKIMESATAKINTEIDGF
jgi:hypothetical protein